MLSHGTAAVNTYLCLPLELLLLLLFAAAFNLVLSCKESSVKLKLRLWVPSLGGLVNVVKSRQEQEQSAIPVFLAAALQAPKDAAASKQAKHSWTPPVCVHWLLNALDVQPSHQGLESWDSFELCLGVLWRNTTWPRLCLRPT